LFTSLPINIGRSAQNDLVINHGSVSAMHAQVFFDERLKDVCIKDRDSLNGLFIDQKPTRLNVLHDGAKISLGDAVIDFRDTGYIHVEHSE
jgi:pSer/pThr/pTyr-binding forkhead associated (FHA) protein